MTSVERLFVAVPLGVETIRAIRSAVPDPQAFGGRIASPKNWHLTLRFLGDTGDTMREALVSALHEIDYPPAFSTPLTEWGAFPRTARATVLWRGVADDAGALAYLAREIENAARRVGFAPEHRTFRPHITIARFRRPADLRPLLRLCEAVPADLIVDRVVLFRSVLGVGAPVHTPLTTVRLPDRYTRSD